MPVDIEGGSVTELLKYALKANPSQAKATHARDSERCRRTRSALRVRGKPMIRENLPR